MGTSTHPPTPSSHEATVNSTSTLPPSSPEKTVITSSATNNNCMGRDNELNPAFINFNNNNVNIAKTGIWQQAAGSPNLPPAFPLPNIIQPAPSMTSEALPGTSSENHFLG